MQRWGLTRAGAIRFRCVRCGRSGTRKRPDHRHRRWQRCFTQWLLQGTALSAVADRQGVSLSAVQRHFRPLWERPVAPQPVPLPVDGLVLDATNIQPRQRGVLVAQDVRRITVSWAFAERESYASWQALLMTLRQQGITPRFVVCDAHAGLLKALREVWPQTLVQRCLIHVMRQARLWLTQHPKTPAGRRLRILVNALTHVRTEDQKARWLRVYQHWLRHYDAFLKQRTLHPQGPRQWWYTHRTLRAVRSLLSNSLPDLFHFVRDPEIPRTTNHVEGGINSRIKDLFRRHRGLSLQRKTTLTALYLSSRQSPQKPTRNDH